ncbi:MAG: LacI family DNA-binding transcriptional regulator [Candidatus Enteromonas sp.]
MGKQVTIKEIAKRCNVSTTTVSYVINNTKNQSISEETRQKIWHVVNMLNYKPSVIAKNLRTVPNSKLVGVFTDESAKYLNRLEYLHILDRVAELFHPHSISIVYGRNAFGGDTRVDALLACNVSKDSFYALGKQNFIPLVALDTLIDDPLFFQVTTSYAALKEEGDRRFKTYTYVGLLPSSKELEAKILSTFQEVRFVSMLEDLSKVEASKIITDSKVVYDYFSLKDKDMVYYDETLLARKIEKVYTCIEDALSKNNFDVHCYEE